VKQAVWYRRYACSLLGCVTACVVYGRFDSKIRFENESDGRFDSRFDSNEKNNSQVPNVFLCGLSKWFSYIVDSDLTTSRNPPSWKFPMMISLEQVVQSTSF